MKETIVLIHAKRADDVDLYFQVSFPDDENARAWFAENGFEQISDMAPQCWELNTPFKVTFNDETGESTEYCTCVVLAGIAMHTTPDQLKITKTQ